MASVIHVPRDIDIYRALDRCPLTARQLLKLSQTFTEPFTSERYVQKRLKALARSGRVLQWPYATAGRGAAPSYYTLALLGYRLLYGPEARPRAKRSFAPISLLHHEHTRALAEFIVHTQVAAFHAGVALSGFCRENTVALRVGDQVVYPDGAFQLLPPDGREFSFFVELDNRGQRLTSGSDDAESWEKKIRLYEAFQDICPKRFRVLIISTRETERVEHMLGLACRVARNPDRSLVYAVSLPQYLRGSAAVTTPCFRDHRGGAVVLVPARARPQPRHGRRRARAGRRAVLRSSSCRMLTRVECEDATACPVGSGKLGAWAESHGARLGPRW
jgi:hypothetical protein